MGSLVIASLFIITISCIMTYLASTLAHPTNIRPVVISTTLLAFHPTSVPIIIMVVAPSSIIPIIIVILIPYVLIAILIVILASSLITMRN